MFEQRVRELANCIAVEIDFSAAEEEIEVRWLASLAVADAGQRFFQGEISGDDFFDLVEPFIEEIGTMDSYIEEVEENIEIVENETGLILIYA